MKIFQILLTFNTYMTFWQEQQNNRLYRPAAANLVTVALEQKYEFIFKSTKIC